MKRFQITMAIISAICVGACLNESNWSSAIFCASMMLLNLWIAGFFEGSK